MATTVKELLDSYSIDGIRETIRVTLADYREALEEAGSRSSSLMAAQAAQERMHTLAQELVILSEAHKFAIPFNQFHGLQGE